MTGLRVVLSHMVVKSALITHTPSSSLRVVLSHMVVKFNGDSAKYKMWFESSVISYGSQVTVRHGIASYTFESSVISYGSQVKDYQWKEV